MEKKLTITTWADADVLKYIQIHSNRPNINYYGTRDSSYWSTANSIEVPHSYNYVKPFRCILTRHLTSARLVGMVGVQNLHIAHSSNESYGAYTCLN